MDTALSRLLVKAGDAAKSRGDDFISVEHLLVGMTESGPETPWGRILSAHGVTIEGLTSAIEAIRGGKRVTSEDPEAVYEALERYGVDLCDAAKQGRLSPVIGRDDEIRRVVRILSRRTKNNRFSSVNQGLARPRS